MKKIGKYIYGIINSNKELFFGSGGITACEEVYTISYRDISAVVSDSEMVDYSRMFKDALARLLVRHQKVIERIPSEYSIIPMRLGTFAMDGDEVEYILAKGYRIIKDIFNKIFSKIEIDVVAAWSDFDLTLKEVGEEKEIKEIKERLLNSPNGVSADDQMKVGVMIKKELDKKREKYAEEIQGTQKTISQDFKTHELMDDEMVINAAFLIDKAKHDDFNRKLEDLNTKFKERLNFKCVGPLPPYSFYTLEIKKMNFVEVDWARKKLGLNDVSSKEEIKKAHQAKAFFSHPDKNPDVPGIEREFDEVTKAYKILLDYCQEKKQCTFNERDFKDNSLIIKVRE